MQTNRSFLPFRTAAVLGAGVMGAQIAAHLANAGLRVYLLDIPAKEGPRNAIVDGALKKALKLKPNPFASPAVVGRITTGNFDDDLERLREADWIIEVVVENMKIKQELMSRIEKVSAGAAVISSNTSGLPIHQISEKCSASFKKRFLGTHFFNPPRYLPLLEVIPTPATDPQVLERIKWFARIFLGKSVVVAKDTPNFIANRIGNYATLQAMRAFTDGDYTIEEIDTLTGPLVGHPKSATFRTVDVVGLDTLLYVADNLYEAIPDDESREAHRAPELMRKMVQQGLLGAKAGKGFYQKVKKDILSLNPQTMQYEMPKPLNLGDLSALSKISSLGDRLTRLYEDRGRAGEFTRRTLLDLLGYCARRIPEIADSPADIDNAVRWGFAWEKGPFEIWDMLGFERVLKDMREAGIAVPQWVEKMAKQDQKGFYQESDSGRKMFLPGGNYVPQTQPADAIPLSRIRTHKPAILLESGEWALLNIGENVALFEFRSKANTLGSQVVEGLFQALDYVEAHDLAGMVIGNEGKNFSVGANLAEVGQVLLEGRFDVLTAAVKRFQDMILRIRYARKPVVAAVQGMALGGGCELLLSCAAVCAALESYVGLVEVGAGLIPAGCGSTYVTARAAQLAADDFPSHIQPFLFKAFQNIATARASTSAVEAAEMGYLGINPRIVMHAERRIYVARQEVLRLSEQGYLPPAVRNRIRVLGKPARAAMLVAANEMKLAGYANDYDVVLAGHLASIMTGGELTRPEDVHEDYLLQLEREAFLTLLGEKKTQERIKALLTTGKPLRN